MIFAGMLLENAGLPLPGETITLLGGYAAGSGQLNLLGVMAAASGGAVLDRKSTRLNSSHRT